MAVSGSNRKRSRTWGRTPLKGDASGLTLAFEYVAAVLLFMGIGWILDRWLGTAPWIMVGLIVVGFVLGFLRIMYAEEYAKARRETLGIPHPAQREVPEVLKDAAEEQRTWKPGTLFPGKDGDGLVAYADWRPRRFGEPVPEELRGVPGGVAGLDQRTPRVLERSGEQ